MESLEYSSSDDSSSSCDSTVIASQSQSATMLNTSVMSFAPPRSHIEMKMLDEFTENLMSAYNHFRPQLSDTDYAYCCRYGNDYLVMSMGKKARKISKLGDTTSNMADSASVAGSVGSSSTVPLYQLYPSNMNVPQSSWYTRPPSVTPSTYRNYPTMQTFEHPQRYLMPGCSSGYSSTVPASRVDSLNRTLCNNPPHPYYPHGRPNRQQPVVVKSQDDTLLQAIDESEEVSSSPEPPRSRPNNAPQVDSRNRFVRPSTPTPSASSSPAHSDNDDAYATTYRKESKKPTAVPKQRSGVTKLINWCIKLVGEDLCVHGTTLNKSEVTSRAVIRYSHPVIVTANGQYQVISNPCFGERTPAYVKSACSNGFPRQWKSLSKRWWTDRQSRRKSPKKTPERKKSKNNSSSIKIKDKNPASKSTSNVAGKAKTSKSAPAKKKNGSSPGSQSDKENKPSEGRSKSVETSKKHGQASSSDTEREQGRKKRRSKSMETLDSGKSSHQQRRETSKKYGQASPSETERDQGRKKRRSKSMETLDRGKSSHQQRHVTSKNEKKPVPMEEEDESDSDTSVPAKQTKSKVVESRPILNVTHKNRKQQRMSSDDEDESDSDSPTATKRTKANVVTSDKVRNVDPTDDESESESDDSVIEVSINPANRVVQDRGSDTSWDASGKSYGSPTPKAQSKKVSTNNKGANRNSEAKPNTKRAAPDKSKGTDRNTEPKPNTKRAASEKLKGTDRNPEPKPNTKRAASEKLKDLGKAAKTNIKAKQACSSNRARSPTTKNGGGSKKVADIFGDKPSKGDRAADAFSAMGGDDLFNVPCSRSMTPNTLVASIQPDAGTIGRYTPPLQALVDFFPGHRSSKANSSFGSPSSLLNNSRDNPVSKRMAKDVVEASKKVGKKKRKLPEAEVPGELDDLVKSLKNSNSVKTPTIVKKVFRNQRDTDDDESVASDKEESMVY